MELQDNTYANLESLGFDVTHLKALVEQKARTPEQYFQEVQHLSFNDEEMRYEMNFLRHGVEGDFYLESIKSIYTPPIDIPELQAGTIDTETLDRKMWNVDWERYFNKRASMTQGELEEVSAVLSDLQILYDNEDANYIADDLKCKYWPDNTLPPHLQNLKQQRQQTELFHPDEDDLWSPALAYYRLSGQEEDLLDQMKSIQIPQLEHSELSEEIQAILMEKPDGFVYFHSWFDGDSFIKLEVPVTSADSVFHLDEFHLSVRQLPEIGYGIFNGVNSFLLYAKMAHTDWGLGKEWYSRETESFKAPVKEIFDMLKKLDEHEVGAAIACNLRLRYFTDMDYFDVVGLGKKDADYRESLPEIKDTFPAELNVKRGVHLLKGNGVYLDAELFAGKEITGWLLMNTTDVTDTGRHPIEYLPDYTEEQMTAQLDILPIRYYRYNSVLNKLLAGDLVNVDLKDGMNIFINADPQHCTLRIYDEYRQEIPFNFNLDVNWRPFVGQEKSAKITPETPKESKQPPTVKPKKPVKKKGRGI